MIIPIPSPVTEEIANGINLNFHFECKECGKTAQLVWENELPESLACRKENWFDLGTVYLLGSNPRAHSVRGFTGAIPFGYP